MKLFLTFLIITITFSKELRRVNDMVVDYDNNLVWQDDEDAKNLLIKQIDTEKYCSNLTLGGYNDWRVPSINEYKTIVDKNEEYNIKKIFENKTKEGYWSNEVLWRTLYTYANYMHFVSGSVYYDNKITKKHIRCVRYIAKPSDLAKKEKSFFDFLKAW